MPVATVQLASVLTTAVPAGCSALASPSASVAWRSVVGVVGVAGEARRDMSAAVTPLADVAPGPRLDEAPVALILLLVVVGIAVFVTVKLIRSRRRATDSSRPQDLSKYAQPPGDQPGPSSTTQPPAGHPVWHQAPAPTSWPEDLPSAEPTPGDPSPSDPSRTHRPDDRTDPREDR